MCVVYNAVDIVLVAQVDLSAVWFRATKSNRRWLYNYHFTLQLFTYGKGQGNIVIGKGVLKSIGGAQIRGENRGELN